MSKVFPALLALIFIAVIFQGSSVSHYVPSGGLFFKYTEVSSLDNGTGYYAGYSQLCYTNGSENVINVNSGIASMHYQYNCTFTNNTGGYLKVSSSGNYTFSTQTFLYVNGTDNQTGYVNPTVWFYINNSKSAGDSFEMLNTLMQVVSTDYAYKMPNTDSYVETIFTEGNGSYPDGNLTADYNCKAYYDPATGFIVGYQYLEQDKGPSGTSFSFSETLHVTSSSYALTPATPPSTTSKSGFAGLGNLLIVIVPIIFIILILVILVGLIRRRKKIPKHSVQGHVSFNTPPAQEPPPLNMSAAQPEVQQIVVKEVVKVKCQYCGSLMDSTAERCPICGAPRS